ncbi:DUF4476 domain-containing protein [Hymenobacter armeniacus]|uniref:DUF4476 domain-containing protein n=1 Tax=Hymenobacter armeniacus TaxID=2771358 RepID=A0ABR8K0E9_9BACT|nr:DUF4476 domain-containing protein [Hymenobacter armeniacus]MBD2723624.1 DUF4476 domain-containing protein [Hymenobacter armeniacus]
MKKLLLLAIASFFSAVAPTLAYPPAPANVNFASERGVPFDLVLDGRLVTRGGARQVHVDRLAPGQHWADFTLPAGYGRVVRFRSRVWLQPGLETSFVLIARPGRPLDLRQVGAVALYGPGGYGGGHGYNNGGYYGPGYGGNGAYNSPTPYDPNGYGNGSGNNYPNGGNNYPNGYDPNGGYNNGPNGPNNGGGGYYPGSASSSYRVLPAQDVDAIMQSVKQRPFEASKLSTAKEALAQSSIQADDLKRLLRTFEFEASRVEFAKYAYPHVADQQNFYRVYDAFDFDASVQEVQQAIGTVPQR